MGKRQQRSRQQRQKLTFASKHVYKSHSAWSVPNENAWWEQCEALMEYFPEGVIACDRETRIIHINAEARMLFEITSSEHWMHAYCEQFFQFYTMYDERQQPLFAQPWLRLLIDNQVCVDAHEQPIFFRVPSGKKRASILYCSPLLNHQQAVIGVIFVFHRILDRYQKALHLQCVYEAIMKITSSLEHMPEAIDHAFSDASILLSPPVLFVAQQLAVVIHNILDCQRVALLAFKLPTDYIYYVGGSGLTAEQEQYLRERGGRLQLSEFLDETMIIHLCANQEVLITSDRLRRSLIFPSDTPIESLLLVPLFVEQRMVGMIQIVKARLNNEYTAEEIALVKIVARHTILIIECICCLQRAEMQTRELVLNEVKQLTTDFLTLAAHELRTPLTGMLGNVQLAQRRIETLMRQCVSQSVPSAEQFERLQQPLESAAQSAKLQQRMINDLVDDARIQSNQLTLNLKPCDLKKIVLNTVDQLRHDAPGRTIFLKMDDAIRPELIVRADSERIIQVLTIYIENSLRATSMEQPVTVQLRVEHNAAHVLVNEQGQSLSTEEQAHLWDRFYRSKNNAIQHELDLSLGLGFYLCREFMKCHNGDVGVISDAVRGTTFWFCLPLIKPIEQ
ncbi:PAS domain-containing sensor histidine kinase [Dictyobacter kobayashii]|uniref:histidine kinase n=1 Tax=Dictyobacter kobayashii TaxID=2014872 RepID=A0A402ATC1_9CHLR|nr:PAS domain-containing sensor histidine kinase [Dictyobacter kobayashii]GCE22386.1 hypothetical protein KDK_61860 [Dictyobacter kobayashii]